MNYIITTLKIYIINVLINAMDKRAAFMKQLFFLICFRVFMNTKDVFEIYFRFFFSDTQIIVKE